MVINALIIILINPASNPILGNRNSHNQNVIKGATMQIQGTQDSFNLTLLKKPNENNPNNGPYVYPAIVKI